MSASPVPMPAKPTAPPEGQGFLRELGVWDATMMVAGSMIGSGIFIVSADIARLVGSAGWLLATWPDPNEPEGVVSVTPWDGFPSPDELVRHYAELSNRDLSAIAWYNLDARSSLILDATALGCRRARNSASSA